LLDFELAHARARDAVLAPFDAEAVADAIRRLPLEAIVLSSACRSHEEFLQRPDLGRILSADSHGALERIPAPPVDLVLIVSDGLSALAAQRQAIPLLAHLLPLLRDEGWTIAPACVVRFGRVAIEDEVGQLVGATLALILLGERPGLGSPDSLGAYLVHQPRVGLADANRNCVSNIREGGLTSDVAATTLHHLLSESRRRKLSGVRLKDERLLGAAVPTRLEGS
jgi:ethanolamine ammonia-lyase small subunit